MEFYVFLAIALILFTFLIGEVFFTILIFLTFAKIDNLVLSVKILNIFTTFSVPISKIVMFGTSKDFRKFRNLGYRARNVTRTGNLLIIIYRRSLFNLAIFPEKEIEQVIIAKNSLDLQHDLERVLPQGSIKIDPKI